MIEPTYSSGITRSAPGADRADAEWTREPRFGDRRGAGEPGDEESSWRRTRGPAGQRDTMGFGRGGGGGGDEEFTREGLHSRKDLAAAESQRGGGGGGGGRPYMGFGRPAATGPSEDVDFATVRATARPAGAAAPAPARPLRPAFGAPRGPVEDDLGPWRTAGAAGGPPRGDTRPEELRLKYKPRPPGTAPSPVRAQSPQPEEAEAPKQPAAEARPVSPPPPKVEAAAEKPPTREAIRPAPEPAAVVTPKSPPPVAVTAKPPPVAAAAAEMPKAQPWRPRILQQQPAGGIGRVPAGKSSLDELVRQKQAEAQQQQPAAVAPAVAEDDTAKARYRRTVQEREQKRREEEEKKRLEREEAERLERLALEKLMSGNIEKTRAMERTITAGLKAGTDGVALRDQFRQGLSQDELESFVPSIVLAKCLAVDSYEALKDTIHDFSITDQRRMATVQQMVLALKPTLAFVFASSHIRRHKLQFLNETQRFFNAMKFPRVSEGLALIEAVWDALYMTDTIEEQDFMEWYESTDDDTTGRPNVLFQTLAWFDWLRTAPAEGEEVDEVPGEESEDEDEDDA